MTGNVVNDVTSFVKMAGGQAKFPVDLKSRISLFRITLITSINFRILTDIFILKYHDSMRNLTGDSSSFVRILFGHVFKMASEWSDPLTNDAS